MITGDLTLKLPLSSEKTYRPGINAVSSTKAPALLVIAGGDDNMPWGFARTNHPAERAWPLGAVTNPKMAKRPRLKGCFAQPDSPNRIRATTTEGFARTFTIIFQFENSCAQAACRPR
jgi:hypothetical protein